MEFRNAIRKVAAVGAGTAMLGATLMGAMAADLKSYPAPFVKDGKFDALIVVGEKAAASDVIGSVDIAAALQYSMKQTVTTASTGTVKLEDGAKMETSSSKLHYGDTLTNAAPFASTGIKSVLSVSDLPVLLKGGTVTDKNGTAYKYTVSVKTGASTIAFGKTTPETSEPILYMDWSDRNKNYTIEVDFPTAANLPGAGGKVLELFGKEFTISDTSGENGNEGDTAKLTLYTSAIDQTFSAGETSTINVGGSDVTVEVIGVNTQASTATATVKINGESTTVTAGLTTTVGGQKIYVKDIFAYTQPVGGGGVRLFIGSNKLVLEDGQAITTGSGGTDTIDGTRAVFTRASGGKVSKVAVEVNPYNMNPSKKVMKEGESLVDPVFGAFKWTFTGPSTSLMDSSKSYVKVLPSAEDRVKLEFTSFGGLKYSMDFFKGWTNSSGAFINLTNGDYPIHTSNADSANYLVYDDEYFVMGSGEFQHVLRLNSLVNSTNKEIRVQDMSEGGSTQAWSHNGESGTMTYDGSTYSFEVLYTTVAEAPTHLNVTTAGALTPNIYLKGGSILGLVNDANQTLGDVTVGSTFAVNNSAIITLQEYSSKSTGSPHNYANLSLNFTYEDGRTGNDIYITGHPGVSELTSGNSASSMDLAGNSGYDYKMLTAYGTLVKSNRDTSGTTNAEFYLPVEETSYGVFLAPTKSIVTTTAGSTSVTIEKIQVGAAKLDTEVIDTYQNNNLIVVGGPCANAVASKLMGSPANCAAGFEQGKATVKLYEHSTGKVAMLVAGMTALDTRRASNAVAAGKLSTLPASAKEASVTTVTADGEISVVSS